MATQLLDGKAGRPKSATVRKVRRVWSSNPAVVLWGTMVGKKIVMAVTGLVLVGFVIAHMLGNLKIFLGAAVAFPGLPYSRMAALRNPGLV
jgi:succinate dehydrogenase / fumarate reductase cytochrome b subunit